MHRVFGPCALVVIVVLSFRLVLPVGAPDATPTAGPGSTSPETETLVDASLDACQPATPSSSWIACACVPRRRR